jgi:hypothetical protein
VSLVIDLVVLAGGLVLGRRIAKGLRRRPPDDAPGTAPPQDDASPKGDGLAGFPCRLGDVVVRTAERDEAWLAAALVFEEDHAVAALFVAPEAGADRAIFAREGAQGLVWLAPLGPLATAEVASTSDPPFVIEHAGVRFDRDLRLPVRVARLGAGAPNVGERAVLGVYVTATTGRAPAAARIVVVAGSEQMLAWIGVALEPGEYDVLPGGKATLDV